MCGLWGFKTEQNFKLSEKQRRLRSRAARALAVAMEDRGNESTGIATIKGKELVITKKAIMASEFLKIPAVKVEILTADTLVGHTRLATIGAVVDENAHPFQYGAIVGVHNGHVSNWRELDDTVHVDSEVIFKKIDEHDGDFVKAFAELRGGFAISWLDMNQPNNLHVVTHGNPFFYFKSERLHTIFWCSEKIYLKIIQEALLGEEAQIFFPPEDKVVIFTGDLDYGMIAVAFKEFEQPKYGGYWQGKVWHNYADEAKKKRDTNTTMGSSEDDLEEELRLARLQDSDDDGFNAWRFGSKNSVEVEFCALCEAKLYPEFEAYFISDVSGMAYCTTCGKRIVNQKDLITHSPVKKLIPAEIK